MTSIISLLDKRHVFANLEVKNKREILSELVSSFSDEVSDEELEAIKAAVFEREEIMSTGVGKGLAIPHGKAPGIKDNHVAFALLDPPVEYQAIDEQPVSMVFLLAGPSAQNSMHIKMLSRISRLMNNNAFREKLKSCDSAEEIISVFEQEEQAHFS